MKAEIKVNTDLKLTIDQLKNYLGTGLKFNAMGMNVDEYADPSVPQLFEMIGLSPDWVEGDSTHLQKDFLIVDMFPICYRLSDLDKFIPELGFVPIEEISGLGLDHAEWISKERKQIIKNWGFSFWIDNIPFAIIQQLFQWHFWPFEQEYFEQGLVIDKMKQGKEDKPLVAG